MRFAPRPKENETFKQNSKPQSIASAREWFLLKGAKATLPKPHALDSRLVPLCVPPPSVVPPPVADAPASTVTRPPIATRRVPVSTPRIPSRPSTPSAHTPKIPSRPSTPSAHSFPNTPQRPSTASSRRRPVSEIVPESAPSLPPRAATPGPPSKRKPTGSSKPRPPASASQNQVPKSARRQPSTATTWNPQVRARSATPTATSSLTPQVAKPQEYDLDSDSCSDDESAELYHFWRNLRNAQLQATFHNSVEATPRPPVRVAFRDRTQVGSAHADEDHNHADPPLPATPRAAWTNTVTPKSGATEIIRREHRGNSAPSSQPYRPQRPGSSPLLRRSMASSCASSDVAQRLWRCPADVTLQVLRFILAEDVCCLIAVSQTTRAACSIRTSAGWHTVMPYLVLSSKFCHLQLERSWLPLTLCLEARDLDSACCENLLSSLECSGARAAKALETLDLRNSRMKSPVPLVAIARSCRGLESLNVSRTRLRDFGAQHLVSGLLTDKMTGIRSPHAALKILALEENKISASTGPLLAQAVAELPLEVLLLKGNELGDEGVQALAAALAGVTCTGRVDVGAYGLRLPLAGARLTRLDVSRNQLSAHGFASLLGALGSDSRLRTLELGGNENIGAGIIQADCASDVASGLLCAKALRNLQLWRCGFGDAACNMIAESLPPNIAVVNLASNLFSPTCRKHLLESNRVICL